MSARDTRKSSPESKALATTEPRIHAPEGRPSAVEASTADEKTFDPYKFQTNTMPPGLRADLIAAGLPRVAPERIEDTLPPKRVVSDDVTPEERPDEPPLASTTPVVKDDRIEPTRLVRTARTRALRIWAIAAVAALVSAVLVSMLVVPSREPSETPFPESAAKPAHIEREVAPAPRAAPRAPERHASAPSSSTPFAQGSAVPKATARNPDATPARASRPTQLPPPTTDSPRATSAEGASAEPPPPVRASENPFAKPFKPPSE